MSQNEQKINISHFVGLRGIGGVQKNFTEYINNNYLHNIDLVHKVYTLGAKDPEYVLNIEVLDITKLTNLCLFIKDIVSNKKTIHFYNNLSSTKLMFFLMFLRARNVIIHERGTCWNQPARYGFITRFNASKANIVITNSQATKTMLIKKFRIPKDKINVILNGINVEQKSYKHQKKNNYFRVGFIGRLDSPKGLHVLIDAIGKLKDHKIELIIAGNGPLDNELREQANDLNNVTFIGRILELPDFFKSLDLLVVPSIREPLGNVCIEAGLYRVPVLASNIDGIAEIIEHEVSGELMDPDERLSFESNNDSAPLPEYVINPDSQELQKPTQLNSTKLANKILELSLSPEKLDLYVKNLHSNVIENFNLDVYSSKLKELYKKINSDNDV